MNRSAESDKRRGTPQYSEMARDDGKTNPHARCGYGCLGSGHVGMHERRLPWVHGMGQANAGRRYPELTNRTKLHSHAADPFRRR